MLASVHQLYFAIPIYHSRNSSELCLVLPSLYLMMLNYFLEIFKINYYIAYEIQKLVCVCLYVHEYGGLGLVWHHSYVVSDFLLRQSSFQDLNILDKICIPYVLEQMEGAREIFVGGKKEGEATALKNAQCRILSESFLPGSRFLKEMIINHFADVVPMGNCFGDCSEK